jgi:hypothetical protein
MQIRKVSATFTRPADTNAYAAGDIVSNNTSGGAAIRFSGAGFPSAPVRILRATLWKSTNVVTSANFSLVLYNQDPGVQNDNAAYAETFANRSKVVAIIPFTIMLAYGSNVAQVDFLPPSGEMDAVLGDGQSSLWGVLVATAAYTPGSADQFAVELIIQTEN